MNLTIEQKKELTELARPIQNWLLKNAHLYLTVAIEGNRMEVFEGHLFGDHVLKVNHDSN